MTTELAGRPTKLTPELQTKICKYIAEGNYLTIACQAVGISYQTFLNWSQLAKHEADNGGGIYFDFLEALKRAESEAEAERVSRIRLAGVGGQVSKRITRLKRDGTEETEETYQLPQWLADMTHLERRHPDRWGRRDRTQVDINETKRITITTVEVIKDYGGSQPVIEGQYKELSPSDSKALGDHATPADSPQ